MKSEEIYRNSLLAGRVLKEPEIKGGARHYNSVDVTMDSITWWSVSAPGQEGLLSVQH